MNFVYFHSKDMMLTIKSLCSMDILHNKLLSKVQFTEKYFIYFILDNKGTMDTIKQSTAKERLCIMIKMFMKAIK